jgi:sarcosine oxidase delta subunit
MLPMFDQALNAVFGESPPELTEEQKEVMRKPEQTRKINEWLQQGYNQDNSTADSVQEYIYRRIREEGGNPEQWRATSGNDELTVKQLITRMGLFGGKRRNQRKTRNQRNQRKNNKTKHVKQRI